MMEIEQTTVGEVVVMTLRGRLDGDAAPDFEQSVLACLGKGATRIVFDCEGLDYINSSGLRVMVMAYQRLYDGNGRIAVCSLKEYIQEIFDISGYDQIFTMHRDCSEALLRIEGAGNEAEDPAAS